MAKRAGILVGLAVIALAISLWFIFGDKKEEPMAGGDNTSPASVVKEQPESAVKETGQVTGGTKETSSNTQVAPSEPVKVQPDTNTPKDATTTAQVNPPVEKKAKQEFLKIDESDMGQSVISRSEVMVVAKKEVLVLDGDVGTKNSKQLAYTVQMLSGSDRFSLFLNGNVYKQIKVGEKLKVDYNVYRNDKGVDFPVVMNATIVK